jgi:Tetratricopeptide repeat
MNNAAIIDRSLDRAHALAMRGEDEAAKHAYVDVLRLDPTHFAALNELGALAVASGHRSAARTAYLQAVRHHPDNPVAHINLGNLLLHDGDALQAQMHYQAALDLDPEFREAHQGLARILDDVGDDTADAHRRKGFAGHAIVTKPFRGIGPGIPLLLLVSARNGNIRTQQWINDRQFTITAIYAEYHDPAQPVPPHRLIVNAIGDADLCHEALARAEQLVADVTVPVINQPRQVRATGRVDNARRLAAVPGVIAPRTTVLPRGTISDANGLSFPLLLRSPGFHAGRHFLHVEDRDALPVAVAALPAGEVLAIEYLDARGPDGMARKYRVMCVDGILYPLHLAISADWKVHYFTSAMAANPAHRDEERRFLDDMPAVLGSRAMAALAGIAETLGLDYAGVDFALAPDGSLLLFEANATMAVISPDPDPIWDYRRRAIADVGNAVSRMISRRAGVPCDA